MRHASPGVKCEEEKGTEVEKKKELEAMQAYTGQGYIVSLPEPSQAVVG